MKSRWKEVAVVVAIFGALMLVAIGFGSTAPRPVECVTDTETRENLRALMLEAIDQSFKEHIVRLHETWMKDDTSQPDRALKGVHQGVRAYVGGRRSAMNWNPPIC